MNEKGLRAEICFGMNFGDVSVFNEEMRDRFYAAAGKRLDSARLVAFGYRDAPCYFLQAVESVDTATADKALPLDNHWSAAVRPDWEKDLAQFCKQYNLPNFFEPDWHLIVIEGDE